MFIFYGWGSLKILILGFGLELEGAVWKVTNFSREVDQKRWGVTFSWGVQTSVTMFENTLYMKY